MVIHRSSNGGGESMYSIETWLMLILVILGSLSVGFGTNLPRSIKWLSIISLTIVGFWVGFDLAQFPWNLIAGAVLALSLNLFSMVVRRLRRGQPW